MTLNQLITQLQHQPGDFKTVIDTIDQHYDFTPTAFRNGDTHNAAGQNNGSCKLFAFAKHQQLDEQTTLNAFGAYYTQDVLAHPQGDDHQNIRNFMRYGWAGIEFEGDALTPKHSTTENN
ncbi:MAG: HopJ type III effector protein [Thiomicrospira sp.]|jgi:hypothetical protein|nr:HopJ type III effector protein [Thiomicrospira sp.]